jgi:FAD/FMN-containing dehydrogenase
MDEQFGGVSYSNWFGDFPSKPHVVVKPNTVEEIVEILRSPDKYPSPIRAVGSNHSTTRCAIADGGTVINMRGLNRIVEIGDDYVTAQAGALYIDVGNELDKRGLQFYVNIELGNLTIGSGVCCGTKDGSLPGEFGQVNAYAISIKLITPAGELMEITEDKDPELMRAMRSSYGLLGIVYEATIKVRRKQLMRVEHITYTFEEFEKAYPAIRKREDAMTYFASPALERITVEFQRPAAKFHGKPSRWGWKVRNNVWALYGPGFSGLCMNYMPIRPVRNFLLSFSQRMQLWALPKILHNKDVYPFDQMIRYGERGGAGKYTFSLWGFPEEKFASVLREYAKFSADYFKRLGYRIDVMDVGYRVGKDTNSLLSYTYDGTAITIDPVVSTTKGWREFLAAYNEFCIANGAQPLFNQSPFLTRDQVRKAFGPRLEKFGEYRQKFDPTNRLLTPYFAELLGEDADTSALRKTA